MLCIETRLLNKRRFQSIEFMLYCLWRCMVYNLYNCSLDPHEPLHNLVELTPIFFMFFFEQSSTSNIIKLDFWKFSIHLVESRQLTDLKKINKASSALKTHHIDHQWSILKATSNSARRWDQSKLSAALLSPRWCGVIRWRPVHSFDRCMSSLLKLCDIMWYSYMFDLS